MDIPPIPQYYTTTRQPTTGTVSGPLSFIKLALEDLTIPFIYLQRSLKSPAGTGASFQVHHFDITSTQTIAHLQALPRSKHFPIEKPDTSRKEAYLQILPSNFKKYEWLVAKHIAPTSHDEQEMIELDGEHADAIRLSSMSLEMRILAHKPIRHHPNIVNLYAFTWEKIPDQVGRRWPVLILENASCGTLADLKELDIFPLLDLENGFKMAKDVASGLEAIHASGIVHCDLKFENILIFEEEDGSFLAKISDFGLSIVVSDLVASGADLDTRVQLLGFTRPYEAPESYDTIPLSEIFKVDVFAFGLLFSRLVAKGEDIFETLRIGNAIETDDIENGYDYENIFELKQGGKTMIDHAKRFIKSHNSLSEGELESLLRVVELSLCAAPECRSSMEELNREVFNSNPNDPSNNERLVLFSNPMNDLCDKFD